MISRFTLRTGLAAAAFALATTVAFAVDITGTYQSSEGPIEFSRTTGPAYVGGENFEGRYRDNGLIVGPFNGSWLFGQWSENRSAVRCSEARNGSFYWGNVELNFRGQIFSGTWDYCGKGAKTSWTGNR